MSRCSLQSAAWGAREHSPLHKEHWAQLKEQGGQATRGSSAACRGLRPGGEGQGKGTANSTARLVARHHQHPPPIQNPDRQAAPGPAPRWEGSSQEAGRASRVMLIDSWE